MRSRIHGFLRANRISGSAVGRAIGLDPSQMSRRLHGLQRFTVPEATLMLDYLSSVLGRRVSFEEAFGVGAADPVTAPESLVADAVTR